MKRVLKRAAAILTMLAMLMVNLVIPGAVIPAAALELSPETGWEIMAEDSRYKVYCNISETPCEGFSKELHKGITYYADYQLWDTETNAVMTGFDFTAELQITKPDGTLAASIESDGAEDYAEFVADALGTWHYTLTVTFDNGTVWGPYELDWECTVPEVELHAWVTNNADGSECSYIVSGDTSYVFYELIARQPENCWTNVSPGMKWK